MQAIREYPGPMPHDYANVEALNHLFIETTTSLKGPQRGRLAAAPFLLFSLRESSVHWWDAALKEQQQGELIEGLPKASPSIARLQLAALSFLWQLGQRNPYAARLVSGASATWCGRLADVPLVTVLNRIGDRGDLLLSRLDQDSPLSRRLTSEGVSSIAGVRKAVHLSVLQSLLTHQMFDSAIELPAAACAMGGPARTLRKV